MVAIH